MKETECGRRFRILEIKPLEEEEGESGAASGFVNEESRSNTSCESSCIGEKGGARKAKVGT